MTFYIDLHGRMPLWYIWFSVYFLTNQIDDFDISYCNHAVILKSVNVLFISRMIPLVYFPLNQFIL